MAFFSGSISRYGSGSINGKWEWDGERAGAAGRHLRAFAIAHCVLVLSTRHKGGTKPVATLRCEMSNDERNDLDWWRPELRTDAHKKSSTACTVSTIRTNVDHADLVRNTTTQTPSSGDFVPVVFALLRGRFGS